MGRRRMDAQPTGRIPGGGVMGRRVHQGPERIDRGLDLRRFHPLRHQTFEPGGHFLQDDRGEDVAAAVIAWMG